MMSTINSHELDRVHGGLFTSFFVIAVTTIFLSIALSVLDWIKRKCQMPRQSVIVTDADITFKNGISLDKVDINHDKDDFDPVAEAELWIEQENARPEENFSFDDSHSKEIEKRKWEKTQNGRIGTHAEDLEEDFHF